MYSVYCHTNKNNGKKYFGITRMKPERRWSRGEGYRTSRHFYYAIKKYGWDCFHHEVLADGLTKEEACEMEQELIFLFKTSEEEYGYNLSSGGESGASGVKQSLETIEKRMSQIRGRITSEETRKKQSDAAKGRTFSEETRKKMSEAAKKRGFTKEQREKMAKAQKGKKLSEETKKKIRDSKEKSRVYCFETDTVYNSIHEAAEVLNLYATNVCAVCKGKHKHTKGYRFIYEHDMIL